jgi:D-alanyl-lipoteichoic acid acyltransferase DltB (MBOAT superfamily)
MLFTSWSFIFFIILLTCVNYILPVRYRWILFLISSLFFYALSGVAGIIYLFAAALIIWALALVIEGRRNKGRDELKTVLADASSDEKKAYRQKIKKSIGIVRFVGILMLVALLFVFKYSKSLFPSLFDEGSRDGFFRFAVPMGISFYTLSAIGYLADVSNNKCGAEKNPLKLALYLSFFPALVQGPIARFGELKDTLFEPAPFDGGKVMAAALRIAWGYFKKVIVADRIAAAVAVLQKDPGTYTGMYSFLLLVFYTVQIYADFTGGIDITIGTAKALGVRLAENFDHPFFSRTLDEYWRRWHMSMGSWFRDYVFYPVSASKALLKVAKASRKRLGDGFGRRLPVYISTLLTWALTGIWHGTTVNFLVWGLLNGIFIIIGTEIDPLSRKLHERHEGLRENTAFRFLQASRTVALTAALRLFDLAPDPMTTVKRFFSIFTVSNVGEVLGGGFSALGLSVYDLVIIAAGITVMFAVSFMNRDMSVYEKLRKRGFIYPVIAFALLVVAVIIFGAYGTGYDASQFIYNQF